HKLADMLVELESARSAAYYATSAVEAGSPDISLAASVAKAYCATALSHISVAHFSPQGLVLHTLLPHRRREHPAPRGDRVHLGAQRAPVLQARQGIGDPAPRPAVPPRAD